MEKPKEKENPPDKDWWREGLARLPLPMLAFSASYGVYSFACLYVPEWVAVSQAAAFELTYIGLAVTRGLSDHQRKRATSISMGAVVVSILYNSLAGLFHRNPDLLKGLDWYLEAGLALLHGAPLAWVGYLVADLLLHSNEKNESQQASLERTLTQAIAELPGLVEREVSQTAMAAPQVAPAPQIAPAPQMPAPQVRPQIVIGATAAADGGEVEPFDGLRELLAETTQVLAGVQVGAAPQENQTAAPQGKVELATKLQAKALKETMTWDEVAAHFGKSVATVRGWVKDVAG